MYNIITKQEGYNMSYMIDKWNAGEVHVEDGACGWLFDSGEFRPLMADAMQELKDAGLVDETTVTRTAVARDAHLKEFFAEYTIAQKNRTAEQIREQRMEARAAMGPGVDMINCITGERYTT
tara:strand:+ start:37 stop:402 length:366 start_codon:yes stop_codon:yes gene_type:complete